MLDEVTAALAAIEEEGTFATELTCSSDPLHVDVEGVGPLRFPISAATARKLCAIARPAPFGRRDQTLYDTSVRDTWEIGRHQLKIDARAWRRPLGQQLAILRGRLGLPEGGKLDVALDKLLVYGPGQFFAPHQDSERADDMVGSLVVELPSRHDGGELVVQHRREETILGARAGSPKDLRLMAFYADCHHEVKPVTSGYRVTLTYHLLYRGAAGEPAPPPSAAVDRLVASVEAHFSTPVETYAGSAPERPDRLIYLLDHAYTEKSLGWDHLKNADRRRADALRQVAERLDCEVFLALADVHEHWLCEDDWDGGYDRYGDEEDEEDDEDDDEEPRTEEGYELIELIEDDLELRHWVGPDGRVMPGISSTPEYGEVCSTTDSADLTPWKSEHEGYMGNYGNTMDRWYHRAAVVLWPRARDFVIRAKVSPSWAVKQLASRIKKGALEEARGEAKSLLPFWSRVAPAEPSEAFVAQLFAVSSSFDGALAFKLVSPLGPDRLTPRATPAFVALVEQNGLAWSKRVFSAWSAHARYDAKPWRSSLPRLSAALAAVGEHGAALAPWLLAREVRSVEKSFADALRLPEAHREDAVHEHLDDLAALLEAAAVIGAASIRDGLIAFLVAPATALPLMTAGALLRKLREGRKPAEAQALGLSALRRHVVESLEAALATPPRCLDDWSITPPDGCRCAECRQLSAFLGARERIQYAWPLAEERRGHIEHVIAEHRLPVAHKTVRKGRPYTLALTKQNALFEREDALRAQEATLLGWLGKQGSAF